MELKANELRLNNLCYRTNKLTKEKILIELTASCILDISANGKMSSFIYEPIPLTEELILKYGKYSIFSNGYSYKITKLNRVEILLGFAIITVIDYLHEFQNLNFALLGCEIKEYEPLY